MTQAEAGTQESISTKLTGLTAGVKYQVMVKAENFVGESMESNIMNFSFGVPGIPEIQTLTFGDGELTVSFKAPADEGYGDDAALLKFSVYANGLERKCIKIGDIPAYAEGTEQACWYVGEGADRIYYITIDGLANGSQYRVQVTAWNKYGESLMNSGMTGTPATAANAPRDVEAVATSDTTVELTWKTPLYNGGSAITGYEVTVLDSEGQQVGETISTTATKLDAKVTGLTTGKTYQAQPYPEFLQRIIKSGGLMESIKG